MLQPKVYLAVPPPILGDTDLGQGVVQRGDCRGWRGKLMTPFRTLNILLENRNQPSFSDPQLLRYHRELFINHSNLGSLQAAEMQVWSG